MGVYGEILYLLSDPLEISLQMKNVEMIEENLSLIGQEVNIISPKICLH